MKNSIADSVNSLPPLSQTIIDVNKVYADEESTIMDMAKAVEGDPMIIANLLKAANSPLYGFSKEIHNPAQAVSLFGMNMTRSIALSNAIRKLLSIDMQPYGITSDRFAEISELQATLLLRWYKQIDKKKAQKLYLAAFLQETGKILIASEIIEDDEGISFASELELTNNVAQVEKSYIGYTSSEVSSMIFKYWKFDSEFVDIIQYADDPANAPVEIKEYSMALNIVKAIAPINKPFSEVAINIGLKKAHDAGYNHELLEDVVDAMLDEI
ncbi:HDOD domain-containing protein [Sulfurimonas sp. SAG-AH-194-I05]|nr:HDOD domain-containing protein [Sulfurimonas sp. SAG-AH-194-I05]MDF1874517.1 HDOD domain-containing protein [Sulfurimonas sp. SAG-AH-194-I05]